MFDVGRVEIRSKIKKLNDQARTSDDSLSISDLNLRWNQILNLESSLKRFSMFGPIDFFVTKTNVGRCSMDPVFESDFAELVNDAVELSVNPTDRLCDAFLVELRVAIPFVILIDL